MNRLLLALVFTTGSLSTLSFAAVDFVYAYKEKAHDQQGNGLSITPSEWSFKAGAIGDERLTEVSLVYAANTLRPFELPGKDGVFETEYEAYPSQVALEVAFPPSGVVLSLVDDGSVVETESFSLVGDSYPVTPHVLNAEELRYTQAQVNHEISWIPFTDAFAMDQIRLRLEAETVDDSTMPIVSSGVVFEEIDGLVAVEAEHFYKQTLTDIRAWYVTASGQTPAFDDDADPEHLGDASNGAYLEILPDTRQDGNDPLVQGVSFSNVPGVLGILSYKVYINKPGRYYVWVRAYSTGTEDNGIHVGLNGEWPESGQRMQWCDGKNRWRWESKQRTEEISCGVPYSIYLDIEEPGEHEIQFSMREDGFEFDKFILTQDREFVRPSDVGPEPVVKKGFLPNSISGGLRDSSDFEPVDIFLDPSVNSYALPADTLSPNTNYKLEVSYIRQLGTVTESATSVIGYVTTTRIPISTSRPITREGLEPGEVIEIAPVDGGALFTIKVQEDELRSQLALEYSSDLKDWSDPLALRFSEGEESWELDDSGEANISIFEYDRREDGYGGLVLAVVSDQPLFIRIRRTTANALAVDTTVTAETHHLLNSLHRIGWGDQFMMGHEFPLSFTLSGAGDNDPTTSDIKDVVGDHPGVHGSDFHFMIDKEEAEGTRHKLAVTTAYQNGAVITMDYHWPGKYGNSHTSHPQDDLILQHVVDNDDSTGDVTWFYQHLDEVLRIVNNDLQCPMVFRPFHEMDGNWFWWGRQVGAETYRRAFQLLVDYMASRTEYLLFCWSPDVSQTDFEQFYPGDDYVDICGRDIYRFGEPGRGVERLVEMIDFAATRGKVAAFTETGYTPGGALFETDEPDWWTTRILEPLKADPKGLNIAWVLTWINTSWSGPYVPHTASPQAAKDDFIIFYNDPVTLFEEEVAQLNVYSSAQ